MGGRMSPFCFETCYFDILTQINNMSDFRIFQLITVLPLIISSCQSDAPTYGHDPSSGASSLLIVPTHI